MSDASRESWIEERDAGMKEVWDRQSESRICSPSSPVPVPVPLRAARILSPRSRPVPVCHFASFIDGPEA